MDLRTDILDASLDRIDGEWETATSLQARTIACQAVEVLFQPTAEFAVQSIRDLA